MAARRAFLAVLALALAPAGYAVAARASKAATATQPAAEAKSVAGDDSAPPNLFPRQTWQPPPPPPPPPPKPTAPPLPFQYLGQLEAEGGLQVFLTQQKRQLVVRKGDLIDGTWRVDEVAPGRLSFTYLPLNEKQQLMTGTAQ